MGRRRRPAAHHGIALIDKPAGVTSHDVVGMLRKRFEQRQIGHTGTLDPMATGLMVVTLGKATRLARFLEATDKVYEATVRLGVATTTYDAEGEVVEEVDVADVDPARVEAAAARLRGRIEQAVPAYSAVKVGGERLYAKARRDEVVELPIREVFVHELAVLGIEGPEVRLSARVSKGTYIRSLAVQLGAALGLPAHLCRLRRTGVGPYDVADALPPDAEGLGPAHLIPPSRALGFMPAVRLDAEAADRVRFGQAPTADHLRAEGDFDVGAAVRVLDPEGGLLAVAEAQRPSAALLEGPARAPAVRFCCVLVGE